MPARRILFWAPSAPRETAWKDYQAAFGSLANSTPIEAQIFRHRDQFFRELAKQAPDPQLLGAAVCLDDLAAEGNKDDAQELDSYHAQGFAILLVAGHELERQAEIWAAAERGVRQMLKVAGKRWA